MIDISYIIESADYRMYRACPEIMTPDVKPYKPVIKIRYRKPRVYTKRTRDYHKENLPCERWSGQKAQTAISEINRAALAEGLSYGKYQAERGGQ